MLRGVVITDFVFVSDGGQAVPGMFVPESGGIGVTGATLVARVLMFEMLSLLTGSTLTFSGWMPVRTRVSVVRAASEDRMQ